MKSAFTLLAFLLLNASVALPAAKSDATTDGAPAAIPAAALKADPWVTPPKSSAETRERLVELRRQYAPFLRSLPPKLEVRHRQSLNGEWQSKFELRDSPTGVVPPTPNWFAPDLDEKANGWESRTVPEWRWITRKEEKHHGPFYPESLIVWYRKQFRAELPTPGKRVFLVFAGVDWDAEVWLNGERLGRHSRYWEPFRFDVTHLLQKQNSLAVRIIDGPAFGEPISQWSVLPFAPADTGVNQGFVMGHPEKFVPFPKPGIATSGGSGFGIHREVTLETMDECHVTSIFARGYPSTQTAKIAIETDSLKAKSLTLDLSIMPENFDGPEFKWSQAMEIPQGAGRQEFSIAMPGARVWWPAEPYLYRCRVRLKAGEKTLDSLDALFGCREVSLVSAQRPRHGLQEGQLLLYDQPVFLRGTSVGGPNLAWYWNDIDRLIDIALMTKVANFNVIRNNQHMAFPEVLELFDRLGILSQQEQGSGFEKLEHKPDAAHLAEVVAPMARVLYNNPGVILFSFMNEVHCNMTKPVAAVLQFDPERLIVPIEGALFSLNEPKYAGSLLGCFHRYDAWYIGLYTIWQTGYPRLLNRRVLDDFFDPNPKPPADFFPIMTPKRMNLCGEYGGEALDNYETMVKSYPAIWGKTPAPDADVLWGAIQVSKADTKQVFGFRGKTPKNLGEYIQASQRFQADILGEASKGFRISKQTMAGYYQFHFVDLAPANWPKSILGCDLSPKLGFFEMAQVNQPIVPLYQLLEGGSTLNLWVANDLTVSLAGCTLEWQIHSGQHQLTGKLSGDVPALDAVCLGRVDLAALPAGCDLLEIELSLRDAQGKQISSYRHQIYNNQEMIKRSAAWCYMRDVRAVTWRKTNVALNRPVKASSSGEKTPATYAVDGKGGTAWQAANTTVPQSLTVDLGKAVSLCGARLYYPGEKKRSVCFDTSMDGESWQSVSGKCQDAIEEKTSPPQPITTHYFEFSATGRYVRVTFKDAPQSVPVGVNEFEIYEK